MPSFEGGAPTPVTTGGSGVTDGRTAAVPVYVVSGGQAPIGQRARRVVVVTSGPVEGRAAVPVYDAGAGALYSNEPALPVYVVSGSLGATSSPLLTGLAAYWKSDEANGNLIDVLGANTLTASASAPTSAAGVVNTSRAYGSGSSQGFSIADNAALSGGDRDFHFACWVYPTVFASGNGKYVFSKADSAATREYWLVIITANNRAQFYVTANGSTLVSVEAQVNMTASNWYFVDCGHDSVNNQIFCRVNNGTKYTTAHTTGVFDSGSIFRVSGVLSATNFFFDGRIDEVGRWNRLLTDAEISTLYNGGAGLSYPFS